MAYKIRDGSGVIIGKFQSREDRDDALKKHIFFGFPEDDDSHS